MGKARGCRTLIRTLRRTKCSVNRFCYDGSRLPGCCLHAGAMACWRLPFLERHRTPSNAPKEVRGRPSPHRPVLDLATLSSGAGVATDEVLKSTLCEALPFDTRPSDTCIHSSSTCVGKSFWVVSKNVHLLQRVKHTRWRKRDPQVRKQWESLPIVEAEEVCCAVSEDP
eukprot:s4095_g3.t2